ncbi:3-methyladenine DNA glycosylase [Arcobacter sp. FWKO B]|nr:3-methyladenine DNA glycosylase [Arcobacter sp. FWKO B]
MTNSYDLLIFLKSLNLLQNSPYNWWPEFGTSKVIIGAILTQNTKWSNVQKSLNNIDTLYYKEYDSYTNYNILNFLSNIDTFYLVNAIAPSGFKNQKAQRLKLLTKNILEDFETFDNFVDIVNRDWLLAQKGIGFESADAILCYCCKKDEMVVDKYTQKLLLSFGYEFEDYDDIKGWLEFGINENYDKIIQNYGFNISLNEIYARFHGKIVEYMKKDYT